MTTFHSVNYLPHCTLCAAYKASLYKVEPLGLIQLVMVFRIAKVDYYILLGVNWVCHLVNSWSVKTKYDTSAQHGCSQSPEKLPKLKVLRGSAVKIFKLTFLNWTGFYDVTGVMIPHFATLLGVLISCLFPWGSIPAVCSLYIMTLLWQHYRQNCIIGNTVEPPILPLLEVGTGKPKKTAIFQKRHDIGNHVEL